MGKSSGRLLACDHYAATYDDVLNATAKYRELVVECPDDNLFSLPPNALIINDRLGEQFQYIACDDPDDCGIWYFNEWDPVSEQSKTSIYESVFFETQRRREHREKRITNSVFSVPLC